ncbi:MAG: tRNA (adenosine(37)-N6)-threonylcarbamoyltransferase complex ATPase subunit type 1 TsaE [Pseudomonadota bacterium]
MTSPVQSIITASEAETRQLAQDIALVLQPGDLVFLSGDLGSGKSVMARAMVRFLAGDENLEVPSPTYTIAQTYDAALAVTHYDLYRLQGIDELDELGWSEQLESGCLIMEWPERCFDEPPDEAVRITIETRDENQRALSFSGNAGFLDRIARSLEIRSFLNEAGHPGATRRFLSGDASTRSYEFINGDEFLLMNSPQRPDGPVVRDGKPYSEIAHLAEDVSAFVAIDTILRDHHISAPKIHAVDLGSGLLLTEYLGPDGIVDTKGNPDRERYMASVELLAQMHQSDFPETVETAALDEPYTIPAYDAGAMMIEVELLTEWYVKHEARRDCDIDAFKAIWNDLFRRLEAGPKTLVLRDYHSPNIIWLEGREGTGRVGVIDFQDAVIGPEAYDIASLAQDARVDIPLGLENALVDHYVSIRKAGDTAFDEAGFREAYAIMAAQRATKILGIFIRLDVRDGKPGYRKHLPRIKEYLARSIRHPALEAYRLWLESVIEL